MAIKAFWHIVRGELDHSAEVERLFASFFAVSVFTAVVAAYGWQPPNPSVHWPGHSWIHFMKRMHVILSIGSFLIEVCATCFSFFAFHRVLAGGFDTRAPSAAALLVRELEFEFVACCSYFFAGSMLLMGPIAIHSFCMVQQGLRSNALAASVMCLIVGCFALILSFFNAHLFAFPYDSYEDVLRRFLELSQTRAGGGGRPAAITISAWVLQGLSALLATFSLVETVPGIYYREFASLEQLDDLQTRRRRRASDEQMDTQHDIAESEDEENMADPSAGDPTPEGPTPELRPRGVPAGAAPGPGLGLDSFGLRPVQRLRSINDDPSMSSDVVQGADSFSAARPSQQTAAHTGGVRIGGMRVSPVTTSTTSDLMASSVLSQQPWSAALVAAEPRAARTNSAKHRRIGSGGMLLPLDGRLSKVSSVASSIQSLDSSVVD